MFRVRWPLIALVVTWSAALGAGQLALLHYQSIPDQLGVAPAVWPPTSSIRPEPGHYTILLFAHPRCPCTKASLQELARVTARCTEKTDTHVLFVRPAGAPAGWEGSALRQCESVVQGTMVAVDEDGAEARRFGAETSGMVLLYGPRGTLVFRGGITAARGHQGDNPGSDALLARLRG